MRWWIALLGGVCGCAYYNAMWSAERHAKDARHHEQRGQLTEARSEWAQAAAKAEAVATRHPRSRWADDAIALQAEGLARAGACDAAAAPIARVRADVRDAALRERTELAAAECALAAGHPVAADAALALPLASKDAARRSRAEFFAGQSAAQQLDYDAAVAHFERSRDPQALAARARALLAAGHPTEAAALIDAIATTPAYETDRADLLARLAAVGGPETASAAVDRMLVRGRVSVTEQGRLLVADADRRLAHGEYDAAAARYRRATLIAPVGTSEWGLALVGQQQVQIGRATARNDLVPIAAELNRLSTEAVAATAKRLLELVRQAMTVAETPGARLRAAEIARDSLNAATLAGHLFLDAAAADTASLYAPKALLAALALLPGQRDSIAAILDSRYAGSPYTRVFYGEASVAYAAAEDSLARELGLAVARAPAGPFGPRIELPVPGQRGPQLEEPPPSSRGQPSRARPGAPPPPARDRPRDRP